MLVRSCSAEAAALVECVKVVGVARLRKELVLVDVDVRDSTPGLRVDLVEVGPLVLQEDSLALFLLRSEQRREIVTLSIKGGTVACTINLYGSVTKYLFK